MARYVRVVVLSLLCTWLLVNVIHDYRLLVRSYTSLPFWDGWITVHHFLAYKHFDISVFLEQHNEHRIITSELIFALDALLFHDRLVVPIVLSCLFYWCTWLLLSYALLSTRTGNNFAKFCAIAVAGIVMAWTGSTLVLGTPFQIVWSLLFFGAFLTLFSIVKLRETGHPAYCGLAILAAISATFSVANGLSIWPVLIAAAFLLRLQKRYVSALAVSACVFIALYFTHYQFMPSNFGAALKHPFWFIAFVAAYIGVPFSALSDRLGIFAGLVSMSAFLYFAFAAWRQRLIQTRAAIVFFGFYLLILLSALMTASGRMDPAHPSSIGGASAHRYIVIPLLGWATLAMITGWLLGKSKLQLWIAPLALLLLSFFLVNQSQQIKPWLQNPRYTFFSGPQIAALALRSGVQDSCIIRTVLPIVDAVKSALPLMRQHKLSIFSDGHEDWVGKSASSVFQSIYPHPEAGAITLAYPVESGLELVGWSESPRNIFRPEELVFLNEQMRIVGLGSKLPENLPPGFTTLTTPSSLAWIGFVNRTIPSKYVSAYRLDKTGRFIFPIGESLSLEALNHIESVGPDQAGPPLPAPGKWEMTGLWQKNGGLPAQPPDAPQGNYFDDWGGADFTGGKLVSPVLNVPNGCLTIPIAHGPWTSNLVVNVIGVSDSATLASLPFLGADTNWRYFRVRLPASQVRIVAEDRGRDWGPWMVIAEPRACK